MSAPYSISVIIPTYQRRDSVERALRALAQQTVAPDDYEVIVAIDGSEDGTRELVASFPAPYALHGIWQPNQGRAAACNAGIRRASGELLILLDDDMQATPEFLARHRRAHHAGKRLGVLGAAPVRCDRCSPPVVTYIGAKFHEHLQKLSQPGYALDLRDFYSGNFSIRRDVLLAVGLFDEAFKIYGNEDLELSLRLSRAGVRLVFSTEALAHQHYTKDFAGLARDTLAKGQTSVLLASKHPDSVNNLRLSAYTQGSRKLRLLRAALLGLSDIWAGTPNAVIWSIRRLEQWRPARLDLYYRAALEYFYWLGARAALRENRRAGSGLVSLAGVVRKMRP